MAPTPITWERLDKRQQRLTIHSSDLSNAVLSKDMDKLFYVSSFEGGFDLWVQDFKEDETKNSRLSEIVSRGSSYQKMARRWLPSRMVG